jgi:acyl-CoA synthetase (AMP-forming)/AMP-acid ligase II
MLPNIAAVPIAYYSIWQLGAIVVPMNPLLQAREVQFYLSNTAAKAVLARREVEEAWHEHPAVAQVLVIGMPHDTRGEEIGAAAVLKSGATVDPRELRAFAKRRVAAYKYPRRIWLVDSLPTGPTGKLLRRDVIPPPEEV